MYFLLGKRECYKTLALLAAVDGSLPSELATLKINYRRFTGAVGGPARCRSDHVRS